jgi:hypothetical protein
MKITRRSPMTGAVNTMEMEITPEEMARWERPDRPLILHCFPNLTPTEREFIMTRYTQEDWDKMFKGCDEEKDGNP